MRRRDTRKFASAFARRTTCHGLDQITEKGRPLWARLIWAITLSALLGGMCWQLVIRVQEYMEFASDTELHEQFESHIDFPAVSVCNYNRFFNITSHAELAAVDGLIRLTSPARDAKNDAAWEALIREYYADASHIPLLSKEVEERGWPLNDKTIVSCTFHQQPCSFKNFRTFLTTMGRCFTFTTHEKIVQSVPGSGHGLLLSFNIMQDYYSEHPDYGRPEAGIKVHVHEHDEPPMVEEFGVGIPAGQMGHLSIRKEERDLMYEPWGICNPNPKKMKYHKKYSFGECMTECRIDYIIDHCGCKPYWAEQVHRVPECDVWQIMNCSGIAEANSLNLTPFNCSCDQPCESVNYHHSLSYSTYPAVQIGEILAMDEEHGIADEDDIEHHVVVMGEELNLTEVDPYRVKLAKFRDNHLMLDVYFSTLSYTKISQSKKVTEISLASDFGGLLGLWLGISLVTLGEFIQFFGQFCAMYLNKPEETDEAESDNEKETVDRINANFTSIFENGGVMLALPTPDSSV